jgi:hypothetical protein
MFHWPQGRAATSMTLRNPADGARRFLWMGLAEWSSRVESEVEKMEVEGDDRRARHRQGDRLDRVR